MKIKQKTLQDIFDITNKTSQQTLVTNLPVIKKTCLNAECSFKNYRKRSQNLSLKETQLTKHFLKNFTSLN